MPQGIMRSEWVNCEISDTEEKCVLYISYVYILARIVKDSTELHRWFGSLVYWECLNFLTSDNPLDVDW